MILQKRGRYEKKKKRDYDSFNIASSLQYFWKIEGDGKRREEERKWFFFFYNYFAVVSSQDWLA